MYGTSFKLAIFTSHSVMPKVNMRNANWENFSMDSHTIDEKRYLVSIHYASDGVHTELLPANYLKMMHQDLVIIS